MSGPDIGRHRAADSRLMINEVVEATAQDIAGFTLADIRRRLYEHARWKIDRAERAAVYMLAGMPHHEIQLRLGVTPEQYRHVRRWLRLAMTTTVHDFDAKPAGPTLERHATG